ncbi:MAG: hypothetical protein AMS19_07660 [Gemmatimonas sp. SG8_23]|nr:MAG: hypothetical protein AMS19_07660 [Gemmatimonas sp. SG8_23]
MRNASAAPAVEVEIQLERWSFGIDGLVEAIHRDPATQRLEPEALQGHPLVAHRGSPLRPSRLDPVHDELVDGAVEDEIEPGRHGDRLGGLLRTPLVQNQTPTGDVGRAPEGLPADRVAEQVVEPARRTHVAAAELGVECAELRRLGREPHLGLTNVDRLPQPLTSERDVAGLQDAAGSDPIVARIVHVRAPGAQLRVRGHDTPELLGGVELHGPGYVRQIDRASDARIDVGIRDRRAQRERRIDRLITDLEVEVRELDHRGVQITARIGEREPRGDRLGSERQFRISEAPVVDAHADVEGRHHACSDRAVGAAFERERPRGLERREVVRIDRRDQREDLSEVGVRSSERQVHRGSLRRPAENALESHAELVQTKLVLDEARLAFGHVDVEVSLEVDRDSVQVRYAGEAERDRIGVRTGHRDEALPREVPRERVAQARDGDKEPGRCVVEQERPVGDLEAAQGHRERGPGALGLVALRYHVPARHPVVVDPEPYDGALHTHRADLQRTATAGRAQDAAEAQRKPEVTDGHQRVPIEASRPDDAEPT